MKTERIVVLLWFILLIGCATDHEQTKTYRSYGEFNSTSVPDSIKLIISRYRSRQPVPLPEVLRFDSLWNFQMGDSVEGLNEPHRSFRGININLPNRAEIPDRAFWYTKEIEFSEKGVLNISADDGVQLYVEGKRITRLNGTFFPIDTIGTLNITIRVLNNAMAGGLRRVGFSTKQQYTEYQEALQNQVRLKMLVKKVGLINRPTREQINRVLNAVEEPNETNLTLAEDEFLDLPYITGPWLQIRDSATWVINVLAEGNRPVTLQYGNSITDLANKIVRNGKLISFEIPDVAEEKVYYYQLLSGKTRTPTYSFQKQSGTFSFNVWADSQSGWSPFQKNLQHSLNINDAFGIGVGDLVSNGSVKEQWIELFDELSVSSPRVPYYLIAGNHDVDGYYDDLNPIHYKKFTNNEPVTYFSWGYNNCAFIALDPNENFPIGIMEDSEQFKWFRKQLNSEEWKKATWHFILLHQPPYSQGWAGYHGDLVIRDLLEPIIESSTIDFVISGHTHNYERLLKKYGDQSVTYLIVGGAGGTLEPNESSLYPEMDTVVKTHHWGRFFVEEQSIRFEARNLENKIIDLFTRTKQK